MVPAASLPIPEGKLLMAGYVPFLSELTSVIFNYKNNAAEEDPQKVCVKHVDAEILDL